MVTDDGYAVEVPAGYDEAVIRTRLAMRGEGFSILTEMHVGGMLGPAAGSERQYLIMGIWNAAMSQERISDDVSLAVHLPCNVVVAEQGSSTIVAALDPADAPEIDPVTAETAGLARAAIQRVLQRVSEPGP